MSEWFKKLLSGDRMAAAALRGWGLMILYLALAAWSVLFTYAAYHFWPRLDDTSLVFSIPHLGLAAISLISAFLCVRSATHFWASWQARRLFPSTAFVPFLAAVATIVVAGQIFNP